jgi:hypothetical protein
VSDPWSTAYLALAGPDDTPPFLPPSRTLAGQTVRQAVRLRRGGAAVRLLLSSEFGRVPLVLDEVTVGIPHSRLMAPAPPTARRPWPTRTTPAGSPHPTTPAAVSTHS